MSKKESIIPAENIILKKGFYNHPQNSEQVKLKQYVIAKEGKKKYVLLRFFNHSNLVISGMNLILTQIKSKGKKSERTTVFLQNITIYPGEIYATKKGIVISDDCVDFTIEIDNVLSKNYRYHERNGQMIAQYDPFLNPVARTKRQGKISIKKRNLGRNIWPILLAIVGIVGFIFLGIHLNMRLFGNF